MKTLVILTFLSVAALNTSFAQTTETTASPTEVQDKSAKKKIKMEEVPEKVQVAFKNAGYTAESAKEVYQIAGEDGNTYKFIVETAGERQIVKFDEKGNFAGEEKVKEKQE